MSGSRAQPTVVLIVGGTRLARLRTGDDLECAGGFRPGARLDVDAASLSRLRPDRTQFPTSGPRLVRIDDLETAFPDVPDAATRLVLTQSTYLLQKWLDALDPNDRIVATADRQHLTARAPDALAGRGPWRLASVIEAAGPADPAGKPTNRAPEAASRTRWAGRPSPAADALFRAGDCRERRDMAGARAALDEALELAPEWEAVHFEDGKFWLAADEIEQARAAFQKAADLMPTFAAAFSNLGATLGELDRPDAALAAFAQAVAHDPGSVTVWNNIGVVHRELGRFDESERAMARVIALAPGFVFGHYNLGHTRLLKGDYTGAVEAYEEGQRLDPDKHRRQGCRLAMARFATGDVAGAERDLWRFADAAPGPEREDLLLEAYEVGHALVRAHPGLAAHRVFLDRIARTLTL